jgi:hypothetical protein
MIRHLRSALVVGITVHLASASVARAQTSWRDHADWSRRREAVDSFNLVRDGQVVGTQRLAAAQAARGFAVGMRLWTLVSADSATGDWLFAEELSAMGIMMRSELRIAPALREIGFRQEGTVGGQAMRLAFERSPGGFAGTLTPPGSAEGMPISAEASDEVIDDKALLAMLPLMRWQEGVSFTVPMLSTSEGAVQPVTVRAAARRSSTVPAGTFDVWHITVTRRDDVLEAEVTTAAPYRVVRFGIQGQPTAALLVR